MPDASICELSVTAMASAAELAAQRSRPMVESGYPVAETRSRCLSAEIDRPASAEEALQLADGEGPATLRSRKGRCGRVSVLALCPVIIHVLERPMARLVQFVSYS